MRCVMHKDAIYNVEYQQEQQTSAKWNNWQTLDRICLHSRYNMQKPHTRFYDGLRIQSNVVECATSNNE